MSAQKREQQKEKPLRMGIVLQMKYQRMILMLNHVNTTKEGDIQNELCLG